MGDSRFRLEPAKCIVATSFDLKRIMELSTLQTGVTVNHTLKLITTAAQQYIINKHDVYNLPVDNFSAIKVLG